MPVAHTVIKDALIYKSLTAEVLSNSRIGSNSTNKQEDKDEEDEAPLQPGKLLPFLQAHRRQEDGE